MLELQALLSEKNDGYITLCKLISKGMEIGTFLFVGLGFLSQNEGLNSILVLVIKGLSIPFALMMIGAVLLPVFLLLLFIDYANHEKTRLIVKNVVDECLLEGKRAMKNCKQIPNKKIFDEIVEDYMDLINQRYKDEQAMEKAIYKHMEYFMH